MGIEYSSIKNVFLYVPFQNQLAAMSSQAPCCVLAVAPVRNSFEIG